MEHPLSWWIGFNVLVVLMLVLDLGVFQRKAHEVKFWEAVWLSIFWTVLALIFNALIYVGAVGGYLPEHRMQAAQDFLAGYLMERSLSFDNLFVFSVIFTYFAVPPKYQHRVLFLGILGALVFRGLFIAVGTLLVQFEWVMAAFGIFLIWTGYKLAFAKEREIEPERNPVIRIARRYLPLSDRYDGPRFLTRVGGRLVGTPMLLVLLFIETTDVIFAVDSIPAIFGLTTDPFIVYTSNVFAILGLRAIYFVLASMMKMFSYLNIGLAVLLAFIGAKMLVEATLMEHHLPSWLSLGIICSILTVAIVASLLRRPPQEPAEEAPEAIPVESQKPAP